MKKLMLLAVVAALISACGIRPSGVIHGSAAPTEQLNGVVLFFYNGPTLTRVTRRPAESVKENLTLLGEGPTGIERIQGLTTEIPAAAAPITMSGDRRQAMVVISSPVADLSTNAMDQIVCTAVPPRQESRVRVVITGTDQSVQARTCPFRA